MRLDTFLLSEKVNPNYFETNPITARIIDNDLSRVGIKVAVDKDRIEDSGRIIDKDRVEDSGRIKKIGNKIEFDNKDGTTEVPLKCTKDEKHNDFGNNFGAHNTMTLNAIGKAISLQKTPCKACQQEQGIAPTGSSQPEIDFVQLMTPLLASEFPGEKIEVKYGINKEKSDIKSATGKFYLDYDIYFKIPEKYQKNGYKAVAIELQGPSHNAAVTFWKSKANDYKRIVDKNDASVLFLAPPVNAIAGKSKKAKEFNKKFISDLVKSTLRQMRVVMKDPNTVHPGGISRALRKRNIDISSLPQNQQEYVLTDKQRREEGFKDTQAKIVNRPFETELRDFINALSDKEYTYSKCTTYIPRDRFGSIHDSKPTTLQDFLRTIKGKESFRKNMLAWGEIKDFDKEQMRQWMKNHQGNEGEVGVKPDKLFENKK